MTNIYLFEQNHWQAIWRITQPIFVEGKTYPYSPDISEQQAYQIWVVQPTATFVAVDDNDQIIGTYYIKPNQAELGAHVCNCGYIVAESARGQGVAGILCEHSQHEAIKLGFLAMQYNLVVSTNHPAIHLWQKHGFAIVGTLPKAFNHAQLGYVDAYVMYKQLAPI